MKKSNEGDEGETERGNCDEVAREAMRLHAKNCIDEMKKREDQIVI